MNRTKRRIFDKSMELFAKNGYDQTSIDEITKNVGVAKGTLYYHFQSKEEIFNFLVTEGIQLLKNSVQIKINKQSNYLDKIRAICLIQIKIVDKYSNFITIVASELYQESERARYCQNEINQYLDVIKEVIDEGIKNQEIINTDSELLAKELYSFIFAHLYDKKFGNFSIENNFKQLDKDFLQGLKR